MRLFPPRRWRWGFPRRLGALSGGGRALTKPCPRALPRCVYDQLRETGSGRRLIRSNGSSSNGLRAKKSRQNTGFRPCPNVTALPVTCPSGQSDVKRPSQSARVEVERNRTSQWKSEDGGGRHPARGARRRLAKSRL